MNRTRWLGVVAAVTAVAVGLLSMASSAFATTGPTLTSTGGGTYVVGSTFNWSVSAGASPNQFTGYQIGVVFPSTTAGGNITTGAPVDDSSATFGGDFCPPPVTDDNLGGLLLPPLRADVFGCVQTGSAVVMGPTPLGHVPFTGSAPGIGAAHMISFGLPDSGGAGAGTFTIDTSSTAMDVTLVCGDGGAFTAAAGYCGPLPVTGSQAWDNVFNIINPPPDLSLTKTASAASFVAGQPESFTITVNNPSATTAATNVVITDTLPSAFPGANVTFSGTNAADCGIVGQTVTCGPTTIAAGGTWTANVDVSATDTSAGGTSPTNCATVTLAEADPNSANNTGCATVQIIAPAVAWSKSPTTGNVFLTDGTQTFTFQEIMTNQGDPNGLGGFSFDLHYDPTQYLAPVIDMSPAIALFAANSRILTCNIGTASNGLIHVACASTGPIGTGPIWVGPQVMANVTLTLQAFVVQSIRPNKENGDVSWVKDDQVTVTNTCGQPLNDGTIQPLPGQPECQGNPLQGVGPGGVLTGNPNGGESVQTWRRLEGDVTKDCAVDVSDMQLEASKFGMSVGNLLYNVFYDVNSPLQRGDGEIDINDVQFVYGRYGSTCASPIPPQPPASLP